jgi:hypothetical protein
MNDAIVPARSLLARFFIDYNPFYLLSALCMLFGLFSLNGSLDFSPLPLTNLLWLLLILNVYEILLVGLGIFLARRGLIRDAGMLFVLEAFFLVDAGFLNSEVFARDFNLGLLINSLMLGLATAKVGLVFIGLRVSLLDGRYLLVLAQMLVLLAAPGLLKYAFEHNNSVLSPRALYGVWWIVGAVPILYLLLIRHAEHGRFPGIVGVFILLPAISILAHLCTSNWVYHVRWFYGNVSPLLLGLAAAIGASDWHVRNVTARMRIQLLLPLVAIAFAIPTRSEMGLDFDQVTVSPLRLTLVAAMLVYIHGLMVHRHPYFGVAGTLCLCFAGLGETPAAMSGNVVKAGDRSLHAASKLVPRTLAQWGVISVVSSFVLLGIGVAISLFKPVRRPIQDSTESN